VCTVLDDLAEELADVQVHVEPPRVVGWPNHGWLAAVDELAQRELPFKCTAGLHHAIRQTDPETGFTHHGFLNVLAATRACLDGHNTEAVLEQVDAHTILDGLDDDALQRTRRWFTGFGSCSILEPHDDLVELGLITPGSRS
jgi:hypothetical protein